VIKQILMQTSKQIFIVLASAAMASWACSDGNKFSGASGKVKTPSKNAIQAENPPAPSGPCENQPAMPVVNADHKLLIYAPGEYSNGNLFATGLQNALVGAGFDVKLINKVDGLNDQNACGLWSNYKQLWLLLPCNSKQTMTDDSFQTVKKFYEFGGGLVLTADAHFFQNTNPNTHCGIADWAGSAGATSDAVKIGSTILGAGIKTGGALLAPGSQTVAAPLGLTQLDSTHPLKATLQGISGPWKQGFDAVKNPDFRIAGSNGLIEQTVSNSLTRRAAIFPNLYSYHSPTTQVKSLVALAQYFEDKIRPNSQAKLGLTDNDPEKYRVVGENELERATVKSLENNLKSNDKHIVSAALAELSRRGAISPEEIFIFFEHSHRYVKLTTPNAIAMYKNPEAMNAAIKGALAEPDLSKDRLIGLIRAVGKMELSSAADALSVHLNTSKDGETILELASSLAAIHAYKFKSNLESKASILGADEKVALGRLLKELSH